MNVEEARIPNFEEDWSIEIFLFSNGQQFSPPRKYYLRADELNSWEDTLNHLAKSHYGLQCPQISLFTTDGQLVQGPLGLKGGQAYVAVAESDRFVDAGYQKYLIKASRSWEKRQARKKVTECVPDDPCCLCPEKEWCCDPRRCCQCYEQEDSYSEYPNLLPGTEYPKLRPAGEHYMSSTPTTPVATDDNGPRSGGIEPTTGEHEVRSGEYTTNSPAQSGYSPVPVPAKPDQYGTGLSVNGANLAEQAPKLSVNKPRPGEYRAGSDESRTEPNENIERPGEYEVNLSEHAARFNESVAEPDEYGAKLNEHESRLSQNGERPVEYVATLSENEPRLSKDVVKSGAYVATPGENVTRPANYETRSSRNGAQPDKYGPKPVVYGARPDKNVTKSGEHETKQKQSRNGVRPDENGARPGAYKPKPIENGATPDKHGAKPGEHEARQSENRAKPGEYKTRPNRNEASLDECGAKPGEYLHTARPDKNVTKPGEHETKPSRNGVRPDEYGAKSAAYKPKPIGNGAISDKHGAKPGEQEARPSVKRAKPGEYIPRAGEFEPRLNANGDKLSEHEGRPTEHETRPSVNKAKPGEYGTKPGEYAARPSEYKTRPSLNGVRPGEHVPRPSEHVNRPKLGERLVKLDECETIPSENVIRPSEHETRSGEHETRTSINRAQPGEDVVRPIVYGSRAEIEHTRRISGQRGAEIQQSVRTGEPSREFEHGGRVSEQKGRETNLAGRAGGQRVRENGARPSEQRNKISDLLPRLGGRESTLGDHEIRPGDHETSLGNPASRATEPSARTAAPVSRPSPRDKIHSRIRTPTRVGETIAILNDSGIKKAVGHLGTRPGSAGGTAAAGASHISEAQQHARRSSLFARRPSTETKRLPIGQNSTLLKKPTPISSVLRELEDKQPIKTKQEILTKKTNEKANVVPVPASNDVVKSKTLPECTPNERTLLELPSPTISATSLENLTTNKAPLENIIDETDILIVLTHSSHIQVPESEITTSMRFDSVKHFVDATNNSSEETQTEIIYVGKSTASASMNVEVQTSTEAVDTKQHAQEESASNKAKVDSDTFRLSSQRDHKLATVDPDENTIPILYQGDGGTIYLKLDIKIRNILKTIYSCQKNCHGARSLTDIMTSEKESQISIEDNFFVRRDSLQSLFCKNCSRGYGFDFSPNVMVVQCAGCGRLNNPPGCDAPQCCDSNKKYFVLLTNSVNEDMDESCNSNPPCRPSDVRQSQLKRQNSINPVKKSHSNMTLDTITTVTVSGVPLQNRVMKKCNLKNSSCQTDESYECMISKHKVIITEESVTTPTGEIQKKKSSSISLTTQALSLTPKRSCFKICQEIFPEIKKEMFPEIKENVGSLVCFQTDPVPCQKVPSECEKVSSDTCPKVQSMGCEQARPPVQTQGCSAVSSKCPSCYPVPLAPLAIQIQTQVCPHGPQVSDMETQTQWGSLLLQARLHCDGRYSFHLPPLNVLNNFPF